MWTTKRILSRTGLWINLPGTLAADNPDVEWVWQPLGSADAEADFLGLEPACVGHRHVLRRVHDRRSDGVTGSGTVK